MRVKKWGEINKKEIDREREREEIPLYSNMYENILQSQ